MLPSLLSHIPLDAVLDWIDATYAHVMPSIYSSIDVRLSHVKAAAVDANLFPAGFNNIHPDDHPRVVESFRREILRQFPNTQRILLVPEEHTRNLWYLENVYMLNQFLRDAGFEVTIATFLDDDPGFCGKSNGITLKTALNNDLTLNCLHRVIGQIQSTRVQYDIALLNNDLSSGIPTVFNVLNIPIAPSPFAGWHRRHKSEHFSWVKRILTEAGERFSFDPWLFLCDQETVDEVAITSESDRNRLAEAASRLLARIQSKYDHYGVTDRPLIFLKSDSGTYGMGVLPIESPTDILTLNRKHKTKLTKGKGSLPIHRFILQEGIPSETTVNNTIAEPCIYQLGHTIVGGFYRSHSMKSSRDNLNSIGMSLTPFPWTSDFSPMPNHQKRLISVISKISAVAAGLELDSVKNLILTP